MENEVLERLMKILEMVSEESAELMNRYKEHEARVAQSEKKVEAINQSIEETEKTIEGIGMSAKKCEKELLNEVRILPQKAAYEYDRITRKTRIKSALKQYVVYPLFLLLVVCAGVLFSGKYYAPLAMEQYAEMKTEASRYKGLDKLIQRMTPKERKILFELFDAAEKRGAKP